MSEATATKDEVQIYGSSDDILCVMGRGLDEEFYPRQDDEKTDYLALSDGTVLRVVYDGCWRITRVVAGSAEFVKTESTGDDGPDHANGAPGYSDLITLRGDIRWALHGQGLTRATESTRKR